MIPYGRQSINKEDINAVIRVLKSAYLTTGPKVLEFEKRIAQYVKAKYAVAVSSGTAALHLSCLAAGLKNGHELITSPLSFCASANCALYCGAKPAFADINDQGLIDENKIAEKITKKTKIIMPVHYAGFPCHLDKIKKIADKYNLVIIEDACHALGAKYKDSKIGDCRYSDMAVFSFHPVKHITTGEGGMITTNNKKYYQKLLMLRNHGITKKQSNFQLPTSNFRQWWYEMQELGHNYRLTDIQCALGISQLTKISKFIKRRREIAKIYYRAFKNIKEIKIIQENKDQFCSYHLYPVRVENGIIRLKLFNYLKKKGIFCQVHYIPIYWHPYYKKLGYEKGFCPKAEDFYQREISIPLFPDLAKEEINYITKLIKDYFDD